MFIIYGLLDHSPSVNASACNRGLQINSESHNKSPIIAKQVYNGFSLKVALLFMQHHFDVTST